MNTGTKTPLILASGSPFRRDLLARLGLEFSVEIPDVDESSLAGETASAQARRLAEAKARAIAGRHPDAVVVGSDQTAALGPDTLGKPLTVERARRQLRAASGHSVVFHTAVAVIRQNPLCHESHEDLTTVHFRKLDDGSIDRYLASEDVLACAGSFKAEGRGIALFDGIDNRDPTALIGLPLIWLSQALGRLGFRIP